MKDSAEFYAWMKLAGYRRVTDAAAALGLSDRTGWAITAGTRELTTMDRLAMSARAMGLEPWHNGHAAELELAPIAQEAPTEPSSPKARRFHHNTLPRRHGGSLRRRHNKGGTPNVS